MPKLNDLPINDLKLSASSSFSSFNTPNVGLYPLVNNKTTNISGSILLRSSIILTPRPVLSLYLILIQFSSSSK